jgi:hypothetical protein
MSVREVARFTGMDPWFLHQIREITLEQMRHRRNHSGTSPRSNCAA